MEPEKQKKKPRKFTPEFKAETVRLVLDEGKLASHVARDLDLSQSMVGSWVRQAKANSGKGPPGVLTTAERERFRQLEREVRTLKMERDILKKATAFFARENK